MAGPVDGTDSSIVDVAIEKESKNGGGGDGKDARGDNGKDARGDGDGDGGLIAQNLQEEAQTPVALDEDQVIPDGGTVAWLQVIGSFAVYFNTW
jgi:hypothetical protein